MFALKKVHEIAWNGMKFNYKGVAWHVIICKDIYHKMSWNQATKPKEILHTQSNAIVHSSCKEILSRFSALKKTTWNKVLIRSNFHVFLLWALCNDRNAFAIWLWADLSSRHCLLWKNAPSFRPGNSSKTWIGKQVQNFPRAPRVCYQFFELG